MKHRWKLAVVSAGGLALTTGLCAPNPAADSASTDTPYATIASRNIFGLNPTPPPAPPEPPGADLPKITPQGIMGVFGDFQVLFKVSPAKPSPEQKDQYYILGEGQRQDEIAVVKIDNRNSMVMFDNHGTTEELPLAEAPSGGGAASAAHNGMNSASAAGIAAGGGGGSGALARIRARFGASNPRPDVGPTASNGAEAVNGGLNFGNRSDAPSMTPEESQIILTAQQNLKRSQKPSP